MGLLEFSDRLPQCSRCRGDLIMSGVAPQDHEHGRPIHLELCPVCDTGDVDRPAAGLLVQGFANDGGHDEGYWLATSRAYPDSPGWSEQEQQEVAVLRERERDLTGVILTHAFWSEVPGPERLEARSQLKHALEREDGEG
jgi:hypothetical protein